MKIGYISSRKKKGQMFQPFGQYCETHGHTVVDMLEEGIDTAGPVDLLFLKITDEMNNKEGLELVQKVKNYIAKYPEMIIVEKPENVERLLNRTDMYSFLREQLVDSDIVGVPGIAVIDKVLSREELTQEMEKNFVKFPVVVKTIVACGTKESHEMAIIFDIPHLHEVIVNEGEKYKIPLPVVVQQYINHDAKLYKVYVIAEDTFVQARESIRNFDPKETETLTFNSQEKLPSSMITPKEESHDGISFKKTTPLMELEGETKTLFSRVSSTICKALDLNLLGYDLITDTYTGKHYVVDVNYLPSFRGVDDYFERLLKYFEKLYKTK